MEKENIDVLAFEQEPLSDRDYTLNEAIIEAKRCLNCAKPMCRTGCPINNEIPQFIHELSLGNIGAAAEHIYRNSDLPAICGRICPREKQCEGACVLGIKGRPVNIGKLERFVADTVLDGHIPFAAGYGPKKGNVAVIGSGPAGLTVADKLVRCQYDVTVFEEKDEPGGMLFYGIPAFRLHKKYIYREVERLEKAGVTFCYGRKIGRDESLKKLVSQDFDAAFIGVGTAAAWNLGVENDSVAGVVDAQEFLQQVQQVQIGQLGADSLPIQKGDKVVVVGAGNVAIDAARTALRLCKDVTIVYRRAPENMKCLPSEYEEAKAEGVKFQFYSAPRAVVGTDKVEGLQYEKQDILKDATMVPTGEFGIAPATKIIAAIGNRPELSCLKAFGIKTDKDGYIKAHSKPYGMTSIDGVFAAGDIVHRPATVVLAMREAKKVASAMDSYLQGKTVHHE